eukprot:scaffold1469_cov119-Cylindrotheca_fusiformis.AAC.19
MATKDSVVDESSSSSLKMKKDDTRKDKKGSNANTTRNGETAAAVAKEPQNRANGNYYPKKKENKKRASMKPKNDPNRGNINSDATRKSENGSAAAKEPQNRGNGNSFPKKKDNPKRASMKPKNNPNGAKRNSNAARKSVNASADAKEPQNRSNGNSHPKKKDNRKQGWMEPSDPNGGKRNGKAKKKSPGKITFPKYCSLEDCQTRYNARDPNIVRGTVRILPAKDSFGFCSCDRGSQQSDVLLEGPLEQNRALHGDTVYVELLPVEDNDGNGSTEISDHDSSASMKSSDSHNDRKEDTWWQDDPIQMDLWAPTVPVQRVNRLANAPEDKDAGIGQRKGRVVYVVPPKAFSSEIHPTQQTGASFKRIVGTLKRLHGGTTLLTCSNRSMPQFCLSNNDAKQFEDVPEAAIFQAKYKYGSWKETFNRPSCSDVIQLGQSYSIEDETTTLLIENGVDHGDFPASVLEECQNVVASGEYTNGTESGWKPTPEMCEGRKDFRNRRIFTIDPTTAKDLDDALHIEDLGNGQVEVGVHIADVSFFVDQDTHLDLEARRRCTTVYLVDRTIPMLPRPLCEIACSLNENVERLAFSCVWRMNLDGSMVKGQKVFYGRSVIKSCARLDYATAQNIIEDKVGCGENEVDEELWPKSRRPTGGHTIDQVAADVRLMNRVAQARRSLRFQNGALALNGVKLTFQLDGDRETPLLCKPYEIRDSNRLVEEYMLLANYLVAQQLVTHAGGRACLRNHEPPGFDGLQKVVELAKLTIGFTIDVTSAGALQRSLNKLSRECEDELVLKCLTQMLTVPMQQATYIAAGTVKPEDWAHFALNIPYYTHFTSPIRRYADVIVHRLLQSTLDSTVDDFELDEKQINQICIRCNEKKEGSRKAQERSDIVFFALYLKRHPLKSQLGVVLSVGLKAFNVFLPDLGISSMIYLDEHKNWIDSEPYSLVSDNDRRIKLVRTTKHMGETWKELVIKAFCKVRVTCTCQEQPPIKEKLVLEGPWTAA